MRTQGTPADLEARRRRAAEFCQERKPLAEIAQDVGASLSSVKRWKRAWKEGGFRLQPVNRRTWAPCGETPMQRAWDRYDRLSVIIAITLSLQRRHIGLPFQIHDDNLRTGEVVAFVKQLRRTLRRLLIVILDRWQVHRAAARQLVVSRLRNLEFEWLPAYVPELNPVEPRWSHTKYSQLANDVPDNVRHLKRTIRQSLAKQSDNQQLKLSFFKSAQIKPLQDHLPRSGQSFPCVARDLDSILHTPRRRASRSRYMSSVEHLVTDGTP